MEINEYQPNSKHQLYFPNRVWNLDHTTFRKSIKDSLAREWNASCQEIAAWITVLAPPLPSKEEKPGEKEAGRGCGGHWWEQSSLSFECRLPLFDVTNLCCREVTWAWGGVLGGCSRFHKGNLGPRSQRCDHLRRARPSEALSKDVTTFCPVDNLSLISARLQQTKHSLHQEGTKPLMSFRLVLWIYFSASPQLPPKLLFRKIYLTSHSHQSQPEVIRLSSAPSPANWWSWNSGRSSGAVAASAPLLLIIINHHYYLFNIIN